MCSAFSPDRSSAATTTDNLTVLSLRTSSPSSHSLYSALAVSSAGALSVSLPVPGDLSLFSAFRGKNAPTSVFGFRPSLF